MEPLRDPLLQINAYFYPLRPRHRRRKTIAQGATQLPGCPGHAPAPATPELRRLGPARELGRRLCVLQGAAENGNDPLAEPNRFSDFPSADVGLRR